MQTIFDQELADLREGEHLHAQKRKNKSAGAETQADSVDGLDTAVVIGEALVAKARAGASQGMARDRIAAAIARCEFAAGITAQEHLESVLRLLRQARLYK